MNNKNLLTSGILLFCVLFLAGITLNTYYDRTSIAVKRTIIVIEHHINKPIIKRAKAKLRFKQTVPNVPSASCNSSNPTIQLPGQPVYCCVNGVYKVCLPGENL